MKNLYIDIIPAIYVDPKTLPPPKQYNTEAEQDARIEFLRKQNKQLSDALKILKSGVNHD